MTVKPTYGAISCARDLCEPWIDLWGGGEWGDSMRALHIACHTSYGFSDKDCALFATRLLANLLHQRKWMDEEGQPFYGLSEPEDEAKIQEECRRLRDYWRKGGNLGDAKTAKAASKVIDALPGWMFGEQSTSPKARRRKSKPKKARKLPG